jgi:amicyanin
MVLSSKGEKMKTNYLVIGIAMLLLVFAVACTKQNVTGSAIGAQQTGSQNSGTTPSVSGQQNTGGQPASSGTGTGTDKTPTQTTPQTPSVSTPKTYTVDIQNFAFANTMLKINKGNTVVWTNLDSAPHTVTSDSGSELNSPRLSSGQTYSHTFTTTGTFDYHCAVHPMMKATVVVQ